MAVPSSALSTQRPDLAGSMEEFDLEAAQAGYVGLLIAPVLEVGLQADSPGKITLANLLQTEDTVRNSAGGYNRGKWEFDTWSYATKEHGWEEPVDDRDAERYRNFFDAEMYATKRARHRVMQNHEIRVAALLDNTYTAAASVAWTTWDSSVPVKDVTTGKHVFRLRTGYRPNALVLSYKMFDHCRNSAQVIDRIAASGAGDRVKAADVTADMLAKVFDLKEVIVADSLKNSANEKQTVSLTSIVGDTKAYLIRKAETQDIREPCFARTFHWAADGSTIGTRVETYHEVQSRATIVRARMETAEVVMYDAMCQEISGISS